MSVRLSGVVTAGFGLATKSLSPVLDALREKSGLGLVDGTLNVRLKAPYIVLPDFAIEASRHDHHETLLLQRCRIGSIDGLIVRTSTQARGESHPLDVIEVMAVKNLRETLGLEDGDPIEVEVDRAL